MQSLNQSLFLSINQYAGQNTLLDNVVIFLGEYSPYLFIAIEVYLYFFAHKKHEALWAFYSVLLALLTNQIIGLFYFHNRPFMDGLGTTIFKHAAESSFPSDHTTFMLAIAWSLFFSVATRRLGLALVFLGTIGASFRIFMGIHYPFDILGGVLVGAISAMIITSQAKKLTFINEIILKIEKKLLKR
jgi:undecaprenyl-diphosphatase